MASLFTPPSSDHGGYNDSIIMDAEQYFADTYYPSPAPSMIPSFTAPSPDMCMSDSVYDTEEEMQHTISLNSAAFKTTSPLAVASEQHGMISAMMSCPPFNQMAWPPSHTHTLVPSIHTYVADSSAYESLVVQASNTMIPPMPQTVTSATRNGYGSVGQGLGLPSFIYPEADARRFSMSVESSRAASPRLSMYPADFSNTEQSAGQSHRSPSSPLHTYGIVVHSPDSTEGPAWRCAYPSCTSRAIFTRGCDLRKHYNRHSKHLFCRIKGCPQSESACIAAAQQSTRSGSSSHRDISRQNSSNSGSSRSRSTSDFLTSGGFSSKKDRARHEAKHNPGIRCEWHGPNGEECARMFSRMDNMKDHVRRIHNKGQPLPSSSPRARVRVGVGVSGRARQDEM